MRNILFGFLIVFSMAFLLQCSSDDPTLRSDLVEFIVTATDYVPQPPFDYQSGPIPPIGAAVCYEVDPRPDPQNPSTPYVYPPRPVSLEFKPEIRVYPADSKSFKIVELEVGSPNDLEYFGRTPYDTVCYDAIRKGDNAAENYHFSVNVNNEKVVGIFQKKSNTSPNEWKNNAVFKVEIFINGNYWDAFETVENGGALTIIVPVQ
jgi:hypothetical protein